MTSHTRQTATALILGNAEDPHVTAVQQAVDDRGCVGVVFDVATLAEAEYVHEPHRTSIVTPAGTLDLPSSPVRGWIRRVAPPDWHHDVVLGSREAAVRASWLELLGSLAQCEAIEWLTRPGAASLAENKLIQYKVATALGLPTPRTVVASSVVALHERLGESFVVKCLGPSEYREAGQAFAIYARRVTSSDPELEHLRGAPFIAQSAVEAIAHVRVVTVDDQAWAAAIDAESLPLDWRESPEAHTSFRSISEPALTAGALRLARELGVGYSSQDWVLGPDGPSFLDLNPGGQWLFLPSEVSEDVTEALAAWLAGR